MKSSLILLGCLCLLSATAEAQKKPSPPPSVPNPREACQADMHKLCAGVRPGRGRMRACLDSHKHELAAACRDALLKSAPTGTTPKKPMKMGSPTSA
jgi:hypothetical protein